MSETVMTQESQSDEDLINNIINDDSILNVFNYLSLIDLLKIRLVCKRWKQLIDLKLHRRNTIAITIRPNHNEEDVYHWRCDCNNAKHLMSSNDCIANCCRTIKDGSRTLYIITGEHLNNLFNFCPNIRALSLEFTIFDTNVWDFFRTRCPARLEHIDFSNSQGLIDEVIRFIANSCGSTLRHIILNDSDISESTLKFMLEKCPNLEILDVSNNIRISGQCFSLLGNHIKRLAVNECRSIQLNGIQSLVTGNGKLLNQLEINGEFLDNKMVEEICDNLKCLQKFEVDCSHVNNKRVLRKISNLSELQELVLYLQAINFDEIFIEIIKKCRKLQKISIDGAVLTDISLKQLSVFSTQLQTLSISSGEIVINKKITNDLCESLSRLTKLTNLDLQYTSIGDKLIDVIKSCPQLSTIEIDGCKKVTNNLIDSCIQIAKERPQQRISIFARETRLTQPTIELPDNLELILE